MIFVTVGTHEQQFNRLIKKIDELRENHIIKDDVFIQTGYSDYMPEHCEWKRWISYEQMLQYVGKADIVISHGGPSTFILPLRMGKIPIVVPRKQEHGEHVNNHQMDFCKAVAKRYGFIIVVEDIDSLGETIEKYRDIVKTMSGEMESNNAKFNEEFEKIVRELNV